MDPLRVLILEDDEDIIILIRSLLEPFHECITASNGLEGMQMAAEGEPDLIICDIMMPVMDGWEFMRRLRQMPGFEQTPVIFLTALSSRERIRQGYDVGAALYLTKPIDPARIKRNIELFVNDHALTPRPKKKRMHQLKAPSVTPHVAQSTTPSAPRSPASTPRTPYTSTVNFTLVSRPEVNPQSAKPAPSAPTPPDIPYRPAAPPAGGVKDPINPAIKKEEQPKPGRPGKGGPTPPPRYSATPRMPEKKPERVRIMVIDDDPDTCKLIQAGLVQNYDVLIAEDGISGIEQAVSYKPDIFIIDGMLPRMTGYQLSTMLKKNREFYRSPIIFISGKATSRDQQYVHSLGINFFLAKPFNIRAIQGMVQEAIADPGFSIHLARPDMAQIQLEQLQRLETQRARRPTSVTLEQIERRHVEKTLKKQMD